MKQNYCYTYLILLILPIISLSIPVENYDQPPPLGQLYHDHSIISHLNNDNNYNKNEDAVVMYRLPNNTEPILYEITLKTDVHVGEVKFTGVNRILLKALKDTNNITIHGREIKIDKAVLIDVQTKKEIKLKPIPKVPHEINEFLEFFPENEKLKENHMYNLTIEYNGKLREDNGGFYLSKFQNKNSTDFIYLATTQFESTDSRHGFPCYDEPAKKAQFSIEIIHGDEYSAISNTPTIETENIGNGYTKTRFETTEKMSSYLIAFVVSNFTGFFQRENNLVHGVYSRPGTEPERIFPLESSVKILNAIEKYVDFKYTFPKMDQISIPDFAAGAMENWGLVTYREEMLLYSEERSTIKTKTIVANTIAHEYGHQWFGNLVSPKWWTYLWLNEGFASIFAYIGADIAYPAWGLMEHFIVGEYQRALRSDEGLNKRPMTHYVEERMKIVGLFDSVSYSKAACVIQMMRHYVGEKVFKKALNNYLNKMKYDSAVEDDLFESIQTAAKEEGLKLEVSIKELMGSWTHLGGFPVLTVTRNYETGDFVVKQSGFKIDGETGENNRKWWIPFNYVTANNPNFNETSSSHLFKDEQITVKKSDKEKFTKNDWLILNKQLTGYYRVNYDEKNWDLIIKALKNDPEKIHKYNRAQLIFDSYRLSLNKELKVEKFFDLMEYLPKETEYSPWSSAEEAFLYYKNRFHDNEKVYKNYQFFILKNIENIFKSLGLHDKPEDRHFDKYIRLIAINWACTAGSEDCLKSTNEQLKSLVEKQIEIKPNLQSVIYCNGLKNSNDVQFKYMFDRLMKSDDQAERQLIMGSLGCSHNEKHLKQFAESSIDTTNSLRIQERINILKSIYSKSKEGFLVSVKFLISEYKRYGDLKPGFGQSNTLNDAVIDLSKIVVSKDQKKLIDELVNKVKGHEGIDADIAEKVKANVDRNLKWIADNETPFKKYLEDFQERNSATQVVLSLMSLFVIIFVSVKNAL